MRAAVENVHHRDRQNLGLAPAEITKERKLARQSAAAWAMASETPSNALAPSFFLFGVPSSSMICASIFACSSASKPSKRRRDRFIHVRDGFGHAFAAVALLVAIAQFPRFMLAGARAARNGRAPEAAAFEMHIDFDGRIAARIENLARVNSLMLVADISLGTTTVFREFATALSQRFAPPLPNPFCHSDRARSAESRRMRINGRVFNLAIAIIALQPVSVNCEDEVPRFLRDSG